MYMYMQCIGRLKFIIFYVKICMCKKTEKLIKLTRVYNSNNNNNNNNKGNNLTIQFDIKLRISIMEKTCIT